MRSRALNDLRLARLKLRVGIPEKFPALLREAIDACVLIVEERERFPELGSGRGQRRFLFTNKDRERHLMRLEAIALVLMSLVFHVDLVTLRCGRRRRDNSCDALRTHPARRRADGSAPKVSSVQDETGLSWSRVAAALRDLRDAGFITSHQPRADYEGEAGETRWRSFPTIHTVTKTCFARLGIDLGWLEDERGKATQRAQEGPAPIVDVRMMRERRRLIRAQQIAAKRTQVQPPRVRPPPRRRE